MAITPPRGIAETSFAAMGTAVSSAAVPVRVAATADFGGVRASAPLAARRTHTASFIFAVWCETLVQYLVH